MDKEKPVLRKSHGSSFALRQFKLGTAFDPHSKGIQLWDHLLLCCFLFEAFFLPYAVTFGTNSDASGSELSRWKESPLSRVFYAVEVLFLVDFYVRLNTGFYKDGNIHRDRRKAHLNYIRSFGFVLDVVAIVPLSLAPLMEFSHDLFPAATSVAWLEFHKVVRIWRLPRYFANLDDLYAKYFMALKLIKVILVTAFVVHLFACVKVAFLLRAGADLSSVQSQGSPSRTYAGALFWSFGFITGDLEDSLPTRNDELGFTILVAFSGYALFIYMCATFFVLSKSESNQAVVAQARINQLKHLLSFHHVPETLQDEAVEYIHRHYTDAESNDREVTKLLCPSITKDIQVQLLKGMMGRIPLFRGCNEQFIVALTSLLELTSYPARVTLFSAGDRGDYMYVVNSGILHIVVNGTKVRELRKGDFFGEVSVFSSRTRTASVTTASYCTLYRLSRFHIERVLEGYPDYAALIAVVIDEIVNQRQVALAQGKLAAGDDGGDFMLTTLYQLSTKPTTAKKRRQSLLKPHKSPAKPSLGRSKSSANLSARRNDDELDVDDYDTRNGPTLHDNSTLIQTQASIKKSPPHRIVRSKSMMGRKTMTGQRGISNIGSSTVAKAISGFGRLDAGPSVPHAAIKGFYDNLSRSVNLELRNGRVSSILSKLLLRKGISHNSRVRKWWLIGLQAHLLFNWILTPLLLALPSLDTLHGLIVALYVVMDVMLFVDLYLNFHLSYTAANQEKVIEPLQTAYFYLTRGCIADVVCAFPYELLLTGVSMSQPAILRIPRLLRVWRLHGHIAEARSTFSTGNMVKLMLGIVVYAMMLHLVACVHTAVVLKAAEHNHHDMDMKSDCDMTGTASPSALESYLSSLYFAAALITNLGKYCSPDSTSVFAIMLVLMACGFIATGVIVDIVQKRFTQTALEQKEFLIRRARIQQFLQSQTFPALVHQRVDAFLDFWWHAHHGSIAGELINELPDTIKRPVLRSMCQPALRTLSLLSGVRDVLDRLEQAFVDNAKFILYGQGEVVYRQGEYANGLFFLLEGQVIVIADGSVPRTLVKGGFIGTASLNLSETLVSYGERVTARSGCVMVYLSREHIDDMHKIFPTLSMALKALEKRLHESKLTRADEALIDPVVAGTAVVEKDTVEMKILRRLDLEDLIFDPDDVTTSFWKGWILFLRVFQSFKIIMDIAFQVTGSQIAVADALTVLIEASFVANMYFNSRLGFYEYGNKIMDCKRIRERYFGSPVFVMDVIALIPLFILNWILPTRLEVLNINKLLRLGRLPRALRRLEHKYLSWTLQLRVFKLLLYCGILSHLLGCIWFSFGYSKQSSTSTWGPPASLAKSGISLQYLSSLYWSVSVISGSNFYNYPDTPLENVFTVFVLLSGVLSFAFVVGHLLDVSDLIDADSRDFNAKLSSLRHLLAHFRLPLAIEGKLKTHYFFQRYHTITQEHILDRCLPPSLLTEIRLVHLHPMITKVAFLVGMEGSVTRMLVAQFSQILVVKDQFVFRYGEEGSDMYFVFTGIIDILVPAETLKRRLSSEWRVQSLASPDRSSFHSFFPLLDPSKPHELSQMKKVNELTAGGYFGEVSLFTSNPRSANARSRTSCVLYKLSRHSLELVFDRYPDWKKKVIKIVNIQQEQQHLKNLYMQEQQEITTRNNTKADVDDVRPVSTRVRSFADILAVPRLRRRRSSMISSMFSVAPNEQAPPSPPRRQPATPSSKAIRLSPALPKESMLWIDRLLKCTEAQSPSHLFWLKIISFATIVMSAAIPYRNAFDSLERFGVLPVVERALEVACELAFAWDIWINWNMKDSSNSMELYERKYSKEYRKHYLWIDVLAAFPIDHFLADFYESPRLRLNRCLKLINFPHYMNEISRRSVSYERTRIWTVAILCLMLMHWCACAYFIVAEAVGSLDSLSSPWESWAPPNELLFLSESATSTTSVEVLIRRFLRSLFFAAAVLFKRGPVYTPDNGLELVFTIAAAVVGFFVMAFLVGEIANLYISSINNEVDFRTTHIAVDLYLERWQIGAKLKARCHAFLSSLWSSHRGVNYRAIFDEIPPVLRTEAVLHIAHAPLTGFNSAVFRPFATLHPQDRDMELLTHMIAQHLRYQGYPRDEAVVIEGSVSTEMYLVAKGMLISSVARDNAPSRSGSRAGTTNSSRTILTMYSAGDFFGEEGLLGYSVVQATVRTARACDLLALSSESLLQVLLSIPLFHAALGIAVASYRELCQRMREQGDVSSEWGNVLLETLRQQKSAWVQDVLREASAGNEAEADDCSDEAWKVTGQKNGKWVGLMQLNTPAECIQAFERLVRLILARGIQNERVASVHSSTAYFPDSLPVMAATNKSVSGQGSDRSTRLTSFQRSPV